jgi:hypothetical protein
MTMPTHFHSTVLTIGFINTNLLFTSSTGVSTCKDSLKADTLEDGDVSQLSSLMVKIHPCNLSDSGYNSKSPSGSSEGS